MIRRLIWWLRRDLRLTDNVALHYALRDTASVIPVFVLDPLLLDSENLAPARKQFPFDSLADLEALPLDMVENSSPHREVNTRLLSLP